MESGKCASCGSSSEALEEYKGIFLCSACVSNPRGFQAVPPKRFEDVPSKIPKSLRLIIDYSAECTAHRKTLSLYCETCAKATCWKCVPEHPAHEMENLKTLATKHLRWLYDIEKAVRTAAANVPELADQLSEKAEEVYEFFTELNNLALPDIVSLVSQALPTFKGLVDICHPQCSTLCLEPALQFVKTGTVDEPDRPYMHWQEWGSSHLHVTDLMSEVRTCHQLSRMFPYYSRSLALPYSRILVTGGRKEKLSPGLSDCFLVHLKPKPSVQPIAPMLLGRSNHCMVICGKFVYVIGGCDEANMFTNQCERLELDTCVWEPIAATKAIRDTTSGVTCKGKIYVSGGRTDNEHLSSTIEVYEPSNDEWTLLDTTLPYEVSVHGMVVIPQTGNQLFIFSGQDLKSEGINHCCIFNVDSEEIEESFDMPGKGGCIVNEVKAFKGEVCFFGFHGFISRSLEAWNWNTRQWRTLAQS